MKPITSSNNISWHISANSTSNKRRRKKTISRFYIITQTHNVLQVQGICCCKYSNPTEICDWTKVLCKRNSTFSSISFSIRCVLVVAFYSCQFLVKPLETEDEKTEKQKNLIKQKWFHIFGKPNTYIYLYKKPWKNLRDGESSNWPTWQKQSKLILLNVCLCVSTSCAACVD